MVAAERTQTMTAEAFFAFASLPENRDRMLELEDGEIVEMAPVRNINSIVGMRAGYFVSAHVYANDLGFVTGADGGYRIGHKTIRQPDVGFISKARAGKLNEVGFAVAPDLAVEVVSPDEDVLKKAREYLGAGTQMVWALYAEEKIVLVITRKPDGGYDVRELGIDDTLDGGDVLPGFALPIKQLFPQENT
jgi:Uma2 family endonuclease